MTLVENLKHWAQRLKRESLALWIAARDARTPLMAKLVAGAVAAYAFSPIDLIPDFIPVIGYVDDLLIVPLGISLAVRLIPDELMAEFKKRRQSSPSGPKAPGPRSSSSRSGPRARWCSCFPSCPGKDDRPMSPETSPPP